MPPSGRTLSGGIDPGESEAQALIREFGEETGLSAPTVSHPLTPVRQTGGKSVLCWAAEGDLDLSAFKPGAFEMEWPPRSGKRASFPELDRIAYFESDEALAKILPSQAPLLRELLAILGGS